MWGIHAEDGAQEDMISTLARKLENAAAAAEAATEAAAKAEAAWAAALSETQAVPAPIFRAGQSVFQYWVCRLLEHWGTFGPPISWGVTLNPASEGHQGHPKSRSGIFCLLLPPSRGCEFRPNPALRWRRPEGSSGRRKAGWMPGCKEAPAKLNKKLGRPAWFSSEARVHADKCFCVPDP